MKLILTDLAKQLHDPNPEHDFIPKRATSGSTGYDVRACIWDTVKIKQGECKLGPLGFKAYIGSSAEYRAGCLAGFLLPRSGLGIVLGNLVSLINGDYQEEWVCGIWNRNECKIVYIKPGMKLAQVVFQTVVLPEFLQVKEFEEKTERTGGFGSADLTGKAITPRETSIQSAIRGREETFKAALESEDTSLKGWADL